MFLFFFVVVVCFLSQIDAGQDKTEQNFKRQKKFFNLLLRFGFPLWLSW